MTTPLQEAIIRIAAEAEQTFAAHGLTDACFVLMAYSGTARASATISSMAAEGAKTLIDMHRSGLETAEATTITSSLQ